MEKQKQNPQNTLSDTKLALSPEQEKQLQKEKEQVLLLSKIQRSSLSNESFSLYLSKYYDIDISKYSPEIQKKFIEEISMVFNEFKDFDESMITKLKSIREGMSFGMEEGKTNEYYRNMIIGNALQARIVSLKGAIDTMTGEKIKIGNREYNKGDYENLKTQTSKLDQSYGLSIFSTIDISLYNQDFKKIFASALNKNIDPSTSNYSLVMTEITTLPQKKSDKGFDNLRQVKLKNGQVVNAQDLYREYNKVFKEFKIKNRVFEFGNKQLQESEKGFGFENKKYGIGYNEIKENYAKDIDIEKMGSADLVILLRVLFGIVPVAGDIVGGYDDLNQAQSGVNFDGSVQKTWEKVLGYSSPVLGVLSVIGVGYGIKVALNSPKYAKVMETIGKVVEKLSKSPEMLIQFSKNEKVMKMLESMKGLVPKVGGLLEKIKVTNIEIRSKVELKGKVEKQGVQKATNDEKYSNVTKIKPKEIPDNLYRSHFSTEIPENLKAQNPLAWIDTSGEIHYNQTIIEQKFGIKISTENGKTLFDGKSLKDHKNVSEILDFLKELKAHEVTHRILEARGIDRIAVGNRIYSQEEICSIIDGSRKIEKTELEGLEKALKEKIGDDFRLLKNGELYADFLRRYDTKMVVNGADVSREKEAAKSDNRLNLARKDGIQTFKDFEINRVKYSGEMHPTNIPASELKSKDGMLISPEGMVGILGPGSIKDMPFNIDDALKSESVLFAIKNGEISLPNGEVKIVRDFRILSDNNLAGKNTEDEKIIQSFQKSGKPTQESYLEQLNILSKIPNEIMQYLDNLDISLFRKENFHYIYSDVLEKVSDKLTYFSSTQLENIKSKIRLYIERKNIVYKYFHDFKDNPKKLLAQHGDIDVGLIEKDVEMKILGPNIVFIVDPMEFNKIISGGKEYSINFGGGIFINKGEIKELEGSVIIISGNNNSALMHEFQHSLNGYMMPERFSEVSRLNPLSKAKDEIIAFIKEGALFGIIKERLNSNYYDYFNIKNKDYSELRAKYLIKLNIYIDIAERLIKKGVSLEQLQITPIEKWYRLDKITKLKVIKIEKTKEFSDGGFAGKIIYEGGILFEGIFNSQGEIINGIKRYKDFYEEGVFGTGGKIYTGKGNSFFNFNKTIIDYERDLKSSQLLALLKNN